MYGIWDHIQCAVSAYHMWRCGLIVRSERVKTREGRSDFAYHSHKSRNWCPPECPIWVNGRAKYSLEAVGRFVDRAELIRRGDIR